MILVPVVNTPVRLRQRPTGHASADVAPELFEPDDGGTGQ